MAAIDTDIDWDREPDLRALSDAYWRLKAGDPSAKIELEGLVDRGSVMAAVYLASNSEKTPRSDRETIRLYERAICLKSSYARCRLGRFLVDQRRYEEAAFHLDRCVCDGYSRALSPLGALHVRRLLAGSNVAFGISLLERGSAGGRLRSSIELQRFIFLHGLSLRKRARALVELFRLSADWVRIEDAEGKSSPKLG